MIGTVVNTGTVIAGSLLGLLLRQIGSGKRDAPPVLPEKSEPQSTQRPQRVSTFPSVSSVPSVVCSTPEESRRNAPLLPGIVLQGIGLFTIVLGIKMALEMKQPLIVIISVSLGAVCGQLIGIEEALGVFAERLKRLTASSESTFVTGFVSASVLFCIGPMTILGSVQNGVQHDPSLLLIKAVMDGVASAIMASALGIGVLFSALTVLVVQGLLTLLGAQLRFLVEPRYLAQFTAVGGIIILAIGIRLLGIKDIKAGNFLPGLIVVVLLVFLAHQLHWIA